MKTFKIPHTVLLPVKDGVYLVAEERDDYRANSTGRAAELELRRELDRMMAQGKILSYGTQTPVEVR